MVSVDYDVQGGNKMQKFVFQIKEIVLRCNRLYPDL